jgi:hypothetical protein
MKGLKYDGFHRFFACWLKRYTAALSDEPKVYHRHERVPDGTSEPCGRRYGSETRPKRITFSAFRPILIQISFKRNTVDQRQFAICAAISATCA